MSKQKKALITGITGQIGSYLAELLVEKGCDVTGAVRRTSLVNARERIDHLKGIHLEYADLGDSSSIERVIKESQPDEIYNLGAQSHVWISFKMPEYTADIDGLGVMRICESARQLKRPVKIYQASTSELFGGIYDFPVNEDVPFYPKSPYGLAKQFGFWTIKNYREAFDMFCSNGILFNSESPRRGENFVTRKITKGIADIVKGRAEQLHLGNLNAKRDWIHAKDSAKAMYLILQANEPGDYVIASGKARSIREFAEAAFRYADIELAWRGKGLEEQGYDAKTGKTRISIDPKYFRPAEVDILIGDASKARKELGWAPEITFDELVKEMVEHDLNS
jgi:GDPmannose 4,6-dehydratase